MGQAADFGEADDKGDESHDQRPVNAVDSFDNSKTEHRAHKQPNNQRDVKFHLPLV